MVEVLDITEVAALRLTSRLQRHNAVLSPFLSHVKTIIIRAESFALNLDSETVGGGNFLPNFEPHTLVVIGGYASMGRILRYPRASNWASLLHIKHICPIGSPDDNDDVATIRSYGPLSRHLPNLSTYIVYYDITTEARHPWVTYELGRWRGSDIDFISKDDVIHALAYPSFVHDFKLNNFTSVWVPRSVAEVLREEGMFKRVSAAHTRVYPGVPREKLTRYIKELVKTYDIGSEVERDISRLSDGGRYQRDFDALVDTGSGGRDRKGDDDWFTEQLREGNGAGQDDQEDITNATIKDELNMSLPVTRKLVYKLMPIVSVEKSDKGAKLLRPERQQSQVALETEL